MVDPRKPILILGHGRAALAVVRALAHQRFRIIVGEEPGGNRAVQSRRADNFWLHPKFSDPCLLGEALETWRSQQQAKPYIFPATQDANDWVATHSPHMYDHGVVIAPTPDVIELCRDKAKFYDFVDTLGLPRPVTRVGRTLEDIAVHAEDLGYPCVVKPVRSSLSRYGQKAVVLEQAEDISVELRESAWLSGQVLVQELLRGRRRNSQFVARNGELIAYFEHEIRRTDRADYTGLVVDSFSLPPSHFLLDATKRLVRALDYTGPGCAQFLPGNGQNEWKVLELNPRLAASCGFAVACGVNLPALAVQAAEDKNGGRPRGSHGLPAYRVGAELHWLEGDLRGFVRSLRARELSFARAVEWGGAVLRSVSRPHYDLVWHGADPKPALPWLRSNGRW